MHRKHQSMLPHSKLHSSQPEAILKHYPCCVSPPSGEKTNAEVTLRQTLLAFGTTKSKHISVVGDFNPLNTDDIETEFGLRQILNFCT